MNNTLTNLTNKIYRTAGYIRLSKEDDKKNVSESIVNQKSLLAKYINENKLILVDYYIDDGWSGTNFNRPGFNRLKKDIELGKIDLVITKDLSRLGRDYIGTGEYLEKFFPEHNVRYIALTDNIDTMLDNSNIDMAPFKAVFNDMYAKDISKKIKTALKTKQKDGKWVGSCSPFGYKKDPNDKNHLIIEKEESLIVKRIFNLAKEGKTPYYISNLFTKESIPTVSLIRKNMRSNSYISNQGIWSSKTIKSILQNQIYTGDLVQNRRSKINYKLKKVIWNSKDDWIIVKNTHESIVSKEDFKYINKLISKNIKKDNKDKIRILDGILYCYECGHKIGICKPRKSDGKTYLVCNQYKMYSKHNICTSHAFNYDYLEKKVIDNINLIIKNHINKDELLKSFNKFKYNEYPISFKEQILKLKSNINTIQNNLDKMYIEKLENKITEDMYDRISKNFNNQIICVNNEIKMINKKSTLYKKEKDKSKCYEETINKLLTINNSYREVVLKIIDKIIIHKDKQIDIYFNFNKLNF